MKLNTLTGSAPLYKQIADDLRMKILAEEWATGEKIPPELTLCEIYRVSRITIRKAIDELVKENLLYREKPKGTFVREYSEEDHSHFTLVKSFTKEMAELGKKAITLEANVSVIPANKALSHYLDVEIGAPILQLKRLRGTEKNRFVFFVTYIPYLERYSLKSEDYYESFYDYLATFGIIVTNQKEYIEAILPNPEIQEVLNIDRDEPVLKRVRFISNTDGSYREYSECYYIGNKYRYYIDFN